MNASDVLNRLTKARRRQAGFVDYLLEEDELLGLKLRFCGSWLHLREWLESGESRLLNANFCKRFLLCRSCAARRAGRLVEAYVPKVEELQRQNPKLIPAMVTLTTKNREDLPDAIAHLKLSWGNMIAARRRGLSKSSRHLANQWCKVEGGLRSMEIKRGKDGLWHPHLHVFTLLNDYISQPELSGEWLQYTGDSFVVGVRKCDNGIVPGLIETVKYATEFEDMPHADQLHVHRSANGNRFTEPFGIMRGVREPDIDEDDTAGLTGPYRDFIAQWLFGEKKYAMAPIEKSLIIERPAKCN